MRRGTATGLVLGAATTATVAAVALARRRREDEPLATLEGGERCKVETDDGAVLAVDVTGDGPAVVLAHCWTGTMDTWAPVAALLVERRFRVVRYDQRGHGASTSGAVAPDIRRLGSDLRAVLEALDIEDAVVAGHSMGGMAAQAFAIDHAGVVAERVRALVLVATAAGGLGRLPLVRIGPHIVGSTTLNRLLARSGTTLVRGSLGRGARRSALAATRDSFLATPPPVRLDHLRAMAAMDLRDGCRHISVPTTVVVGTRDVLTPPSYGYDLAASIPGAHVVEVKGAGHMLPFEATDLLADIIAEAHS